MEHSPERTGRKRAQILRTALDLFTTHGMDRISVNEIAARARVSKVTLYKYFGTKDALYAEVVDVALADILAHLEALFHADVDFWQKLKGALVIQTTTLHWVNWEYLLEVWERQGGTGLHTRVNTLIAQLVAEGQALGFIDPTLSLDLILLYAEVFRAGLKATFGEQVGRVPDEHTLDTLIQLYFFGLLKRP